MNTDIVDLYNRIGGESYNKRGFTPISFLIKKHLLSKSNLKTGDKVLVLFCGSGQDFKPILDVIGPTGEIVGVDFSESMLKVAQKNIENQNVKNVTLIEDDVLKFNNEEYHNYFDAVFCSMGIALDDDSSKVFSRLNTFQNEESQIIIFDLKFPDHSIGKIVYSLILEKITNHYGGNREKHISSSSLYHDLSKDKKCTFSTQYLFGTFYSVIMNNK